MNEIISPNAPPLPVRTSDIVQERLKVLHDTHGLSWRKIAALDEFAPIPAGTLCAVYNGEPVPHRWRARLGIPVEINVNIYVMVFLLINFHPKRERVYLKWRDMPKWAVKWSLENREPI